MPFSFSLICKLGSYVARRKRYTDQGHPCQTLRFKGNLPLFSLIELFPLVYDVLTDLQKKIPNPNLFWAVIIKSCSKESEAL